MATSYDSKSHYSIGYDLIEHKGKVTKTIVTNSDANVFVQDLDFLDYEIGFVPIEFANRPDLIANTFYGSPKDWWLLAMINNKPDPFEGFSINERIIIPKNVI
tara:strand:+ start:712 stop:1020 length:309 start_codon:yes stop_codon:yes gene_type:complete